MRLSRPRTRPRCDRIEDGALVNLRGPARAYRRLTGSFDPLWVRGKGTASRRRARRDQDGLAQMEAGRILDPGDLVAAFARAIPSSSHRNRWRLGDTSTMQTTRAANVYSFAADHRRIRSERSPIAASSPPGPRRALTLPLTSTGWPKRTASTSAKPPTALPA
jgi:zinc transporter